MCLAVPMKVIQLLQGKGTVDIGGVQREVDFSLLDGTKEGDYVLVHAGFALSRIDEEEAIRNLKTFAELGQQLPPQGDVT
jgi:hydrogenase expression/formation protein HypC